MNQKDYIAIARTIRDEYASLIEGMDRITNSQSAQYKHLAARKEAVAALGTELSMMLKLRHPKLNRVEFLAVLSGD